jgi:hypothetical protein
MSLVDEEDVFWIPPSGRETYFVRDVGIRLPPRRSIIAWTAGLYRHVGNYQTRVEDRVEDLLVNVR